MAYKIWLSPPHLSQDEKELIGDALQSNWIAPNGPHLDEFERIISDYLGGNYYVVGLNSGTAAIHLALILSGVQENDFVICPSNTFVATANPIKYLGAHPVFVDSEPETWNMCPNLLEGAIKSCIKHHKKPTAILGVHIYGMPYKHPEIQFLSKKYDIPIIEDSAEALGSRINNYKCGTLGDFGVLSFNGNKIITTSGGGALIVKKDALSKKAKYLASQAKSNTKYLHHEQVGYNYRLSNILASLGIAQMSKLNDYISNRRANFEFYKESLTPLFNKLDFQRESGGVYSNRWLSCFSFEHNKVKEQIIEGLTEANIECRPFWKPLHTQPVFKNDLKFINGVSEDLFEKGLCLPSGSALKASEKEEIIEIIRTSI